MERQRVAITKAGPFSQTEGLELLSHVVDWRGYANGGYHGYAGIYGMYNVAFIKGPNTPEFFTVAVTISGFPVDTISIPKNSRIGTRANELYEELTHSRDVGDIPGSLHTTSLRSQLRRFLREH